jgi:two-component system CheB/CheR fusion protein
MAKKKRTAASSKASPRRKVIPKRASSSVKPQSGEAAPSGEQANAPGFPIVGIGASAGGLNAFKRFFTALPVRSGMAFVLIPHLDPTHQSLMVELLAKYTTEPVVEATEGMVVKPNHVYILPPNKYMTIREGTLRLTGPVERRGAQTSIDVFLRSLAEDQQERAICVILSGTGAHGTLGLKAIKASGGMAMVQEPKSAEFDRMPLSASTRGWPTTFCPRNKCRRR